MTSIFSLLHVNPKFVNVSQLNQLKIKVKIMVSGFPNVGYNFQTFKSDRDIENFFLIHIHAIFLKLIFICQLSKIKSNFQVVS